MLNIGSPLSTLIRFFKHLKHENLLPFSAENCLEAVTVLSCWYNLERLPEIYQPIFHPVFSHVKPERPCEDRLTLVLQDMDDSAATINDIGCQIGYFTFSLAEKGHMVSSYDMDRRNINVCNLLNSLSRLDPRPNFYNISLSEENKDHFFPKDYTLCLAVFHHIIVNYGLVYSQELVKTLRRITNNRLYFEIGQSNEPVKEWSSDLPDMGSDPLDWISDFLEKGGFKEIVVLGLIPTHVSDVNRYLISAT